MQTFTTLLALALSATAAIAAPSLAGGPSARNAARNYPHTVDITAFGAPPEVAQNHISGIPVGTSESGDFIDISTRGENPQLSISSVTWTDFDNVSCRFEGIDTANNAPPVLSNEITVADGRSALQVGPPQTLIGVYCWVH
jgi:hypothetical protein